MKGALLAICVMAAIILCVSTNADAGPARSESISIFHKILVFAHYTAFSGKPTTAIANHNLII